MADKRRQMSALVPEGSSEYRMDNRGAMNANRALRIGCAVAMSGLSLASLSCTRTIRVTEEMTWECVPGEYNRAFSAKPGDYVRLRYVENPHCFELLASKDFCAELRRFGRSIVRVDFDAWGKGKKVHGYSIRAVNGHPIHEIDGWGGSGANDYSGPSPIDNAFSSH